LQTKAGFTVPCPAAGVCRMEKSTERIQQKPKRFLTKVRIVFLLFKEAGISIFGLTALCSILQSVYLEFIRLIVATWRLNACLAVSDHSGTRR
jgi:hypothetical protein